MTDIADVDRHVTADDDDSIAVALISSLRNRPHVVLLGEPGSGKSTVLAREANAAGVQAITVRKLLNRGPPVDSTILFIDALDEFRSDGSSDKIHDLADAIEKAGSERWWLTCRAEDWRKLGDLAILDEVVAGRPIIVVRLQPLDPQEQAAVLAAMGEADPAAFLEKARRLGAEGLCGSPLSLKLLQRAVLKGGAWPKTRFDLFDLATLQLAGEHDPMRRTNMDRPAPEILREAAGRAFLVQLASGARGIWRSNVEPEEEGLVRGFDLGIDQAVLKATLDTALFAGEGEAFDPIHRSVAEFLAARALAEAVTGVAGQAALPLRRALALITTVDGGPPTELRGLFGWFGVHLAQRGRADDALKLIETEATTALVYGDPAAIPTKLRRALFENLGTKDPWFRNGEGSATVGSLAGEDLADLFSVVLAASPGQTHKLFTVFEALTEGAPVVSLRPRLRAMILDQNLGEGVRWRAVDAYLNGFENRVGEQRALFDDLAALPPSNDNGRLKLHLITGMPGDAVTVADLKSVVIDAITARVRNSSLNLYSLGSWFDRNPKPDLFATPVTSWVPKQNPDKSHNIEVQNFFDVAAAALVKAQDPAPAALWTLVSDAALTKSVQLKDGLRAAIDAWLEKGPDRALGLIDALIVATIEPNRASKIWGRFERLARQKISPALVRHLMEKSKGASLEECRLLLELASFFARSFEANEQTYWDLVALIKQQQNMADLADGLTLDEIPDWRFEEIDRQKRQSADFQKAVLDNIRVMTPSLDKVRSGKAGGWLNWGAERYLHPFDVDASVVRGLDRVARLANDQIAGAMADGWMVLAANGTPYLTSSRLGALEANSKRNQAEYSIVAGLQRKRSLGSGLGEPPLSVAIVALRNAFIIEDPADRAVFERWAVERLKQDVAAGTTALLEFWLAANRAKSTRLEYMSEVARDGASVLRPVLIALLTKRPNMPMEALGTTLHHAIALLDRAVLTGVARKALARKSLDVEQRARWYATLFRLDPVSVGAAFAAELPDEKRRLMLTLPHLDQGPSAFDGLPEDAAIARDLILIREVGSRHEPDDRFGGTIGSRQMLSGIVSAAIGRLAALPSVAVGDTLESLSVLPALVRWAPHLQHAVAEQVRVRRDFAFRIPIPAVVRAALTGGPPANASDLRAIALDELERLARETQIGSTSPWRRYWNTDGSSRPINPRNENECRNQVLDYVAQAMKPFGITAALPEGQRANDTRADMLILGHEGANLPVEAKRHYNDELWTAPIEQLEPYTRAPGAAGFGIYLVFWFGAGFPTPKRAKGGRPKTMTEMLALLEADLPVALRDRISVVGFDVSAPPATKMSVPPKQKAPKTQTPKP